jgi:hypothetical protein
MITQTQNIEMTEFKKQIHCKLTYKDQIRRFLFCGTEFTELRGHVSNLLSLNDGFVLKYLDNESDLITLTNNEDLYLALDLSPKLLRLVVHDTVPLNLQPPISSLPFLPSGTPPPSVGNTQSCSGAPSGTIPPPSVFPFNPGYRYFPHQEQQNRPSRSEIAAQRVQSKIDYFKGLLAQTPPEDWRHQDLQNQIQRLEGRLARINNWKEKRGNCPKHFHKWKKEEKRREKKEQKHPSLSPEAVTQIQTLKTQIQTLKPVICQLKATKKAKKMELDLCLQNGQGDKENLWNEILRLKESLMENKKQLATLKDQIKEIRSAKFQ